MKFTENCIELKTDTPTDIIKGVLILTFTAPYRLITEVSSKVIFLGKEKIQKVLLFAILIAAYVLLGMLIGLKFEGEFDLLSGRFPPIIVIAALVLLIVLYAIFAKFNFVIYDQFDQLFTKTLEYEDNEVEEANAEVESNKEDFEQSSDVSQFIVTADEIERDRQEEIVESSVEDLLSDELHTSEAKTPEFTEEEKGVKQISEVYNFEYSDIVNKLRNSDTAYNGFMSATKIQELSDEMEDSVDPSKYINEELISMFLEEIENDVTQSIEDLDLTVIPSGFTCIS